MKQGGVGKGPIQTMGIQKYLDSTSDLHNGNGYSDFERMINVPQPNIAKIARDMNVRTREVIYRWAKAAGIKITRARRKSTPKTVQSPPGEPAPKVDNNDKKWL